MYRLPKEEAVVFIDTVAGLTFVTRYHGHSVISEQSVADHSCRVGMLAYMLALEYYKNENDAYRVATFALFHDFSEGILKNDVNSSIKQKYGIRDILRQLEQDVVNDMFPSDTASSNSLRNLVLEKCDPVDYKLLKMADTLDFGLYVWHEVNLGNSHLKPLLEAFKAEFNKYDYDMRSLDLARLTFSKILAETPDE
jgi:5'-deoxynucleotidase YfbR-like HD superfamily hydrolase